MSKHTPGAWKWSDDYQDRRGEKTWSLLGKDGYGILSCDGIGNSPQGLGNDDNARLIAAAPDLLEALWGFYKTGVVAPPDVWEKAGDAIVKATGAKP